MKTRLQDIFYKNILAVVIVTLALSQNVQCITDECTGASSLGDTRRTTTEDPGTCGGLCDNNINEDAWYRLDVSNSGARMPESFVEVWHCGTYIPIWLNGAHPTETYPGPVTLSVCAQLRVGGPTCEWRSQISVKRCYDGSEYFVYQLKATPFCDMAYCAGSGINCANNGSWNDVTKSCTNPPTPPLTANPTLVGPYISEMKEVTDDKGKAFTATKFSMKCIFDYTRKTTDDGARYDVIFESNRQVVYQRTLLSTDQPEVVMSESYLVGRVGQTVTCKVNSYWQAQFPTRSPYRASPPFKFEIYFISKLNARMDSLNIAEGTSEQVKVQTSFSITTPWCFNLQEGSPCYPYYTFLLSSKSLLLSVCTFKIANDTRTSGDIWLSSVPDVSPGGEIGYMEFQTESTNQAQYSIFASYTSKRYQVTINDPTAWPLCSSLGDPHITTFGQNYYYHIYLEGDFVLLEVKTKNIKVHVRHYYCGGGATCNCGVIAQEGNNVLGINNCGSSILIERYLYDEANPGGTIRFLGGSRWIITLPSGLSITVDVYGKVINLSVQGNGADSYEGLCTNTLPSQCDGGCLCTDDCRKYQVTGSNSLFSYSRENPPSCLSPKPPIVPQCDCINGASPNRICDKPDPTNLLSPTSDKSVCKSTSGRRKRQSSSDSSNPTFDRYSEQSTPNNQWPTRSGITEQDAINACTSSLRTSKVYDLCTTELKLNITPTFDICVLDIQILDDKINPPLSLPSQMELLCSRTIDIASNGTNNTVKQIFLTNACLRQCSQNGICTNGQCICNQGYMSSDCSLPQGAVPVITALDSATCNVRNVQGSDYCRIVSLHTVNASSNNVHCQFKVDTKVIYLDKSPSVSGDLVKCNVPPVPVLPGLSFNQTVTNYAVYVSISNDAASNKFSNEMKFIIYDGLCVSCNASDVCTSKKTACNILGRCYEPEAVMYCGKNMTDPRVCDPNVTTTKWLPKNSRIESKGSTTCSSSRPTASAMILFFSYLFIKLIKLIKDKYA